MEDENEELLNLTPIEPPKYLFRRVINHIHTEEKFIASKRKAVVFFIVLSASLATFSAVLLLLMGTISQSAILEILSLVVSDPGVVMANWRDFSLFLLESLPIGYMAIFLIALFVLLESLKYLVKYLAMALSLKRKII